MDVNFLDIILNAISTYISIPYILSVNIFTYILIKKTEFLTNKEFLTNFQKRMITLGVSVLMFVAFYFYKITNLEVLTLSLFVSPISYNYVLKKILKMSGISYKSQDLKLF
jgi:hypothetical protein